MGHGQQQHNNSPNISADSLLVPDLSANLLVAPLHSFWLICQQAKELGAGRRFGHGGGDWFDGVHCEVQEHLSSSSLWHHHQGSHHGNPPLCEVCKVCELSFFSVITLSQPSTRFVAVPMRIWICDNWDSLCDKKSSLHEQCALDLWQHDHQPDCHKCYLVNYDSSPTRHRRCM